MYEAKQNKEKVSRRIEGVNGMLQRIGIQDWRKKSKVDKPLSTKQFVCHNKNENIICKNRANISNPIQRTTEILWNNVQPYQYIDRNGQSQTIDFGQSMIAHLDANDPKRGSAPGGGQQADARNDATRSNGGNMILGHLLNDNLGGPGLPFNLYPISTVANAEHLASVETYVKNAVMRNINQPGDPNQNNIHVIYRVNITPKTGVGNGGSRRHANLSPDATLVCSWRCFSNGRWLQQNTKTITSKAGDDYLPIRGNWGTYGTGERFKTFFGTPLPSHIRISFLNQPINYKGVIYSRIVHQINGNEIGLLV